MSSTGSPRSRAEVVRVLEVDADLARDVPPEEVPLARERAVAPVVSISPGSWEPPGAFEQAPEAIGLLVLDGLLLRNVELAGIGCSELLGPGDLLHVREGAEGEPSLPFGLEWEAIEPTHVAVLDGSFAAAVARWPSVGGRLHARAARVAHSLGVHFAITCFVGLKVKLYLLFWHLADRFGRVDAEGVLVPVRLTHEHLAGLVGARRPSVTTALKALAEQGLVIRRDDDWLLLGDAASEFERLRRVSPAADATDARGDTEP